MNGLKSKKQVSFFVLFLLLTSIGISCNDDPDEPTNPTPIENPDPDPDPDPNPIPDPEPDPLDSTTFSVEFTSIRDGYEDGKASDLVVSFKPPSSDSVTFIRIFGVLANNIEDVNYDGLPNLTSAQFIDVPNDEENYELRLNEDLQDYKGNPFEPDTAYIFYAIAYGTYLGETIEILSGPSEGIDIIERVAVSTLVPSFIADDGLSIDADGNIYASEFTQAGTGTRIIKVTPTGETSTYASGLSGSLGSTFDQNGNFYVTNNFDARNRKVVKITPDGTQSDIAVIPGYPAGLILKEDGNLLVSNYSSSKIYLLTPEGDTSVYVDDPLLEGAVGMAYDDDGNLIAGNFITGNILSINPAKEVTLIASIEVVVAGNVIGYLTYLDGFIYATGIRSHKVYKVSLDGNVETYAGTGVNRTFDAPLLEASFSGCNGIVANKQTKTLYISQFSSKALREIKTVLE